jgi:phosphoglycolate phosphatase
MDELRKRGIAIAVATYKRQDYAESILKHFKFDEYSDILYGADHENKLKKPDIIRLCMRDMDIDDPSDVVMVGDSSHDATGAKALGMDFIGVTYGFDFRTKEDVDKYSAIGSVDKPIEILRFFE